MIFDATLQFSDNQAITGSGPSDNAVDLGATGTVFGASTPLARDIGNGHCVPLFVAVTEDFADLTDLVVALEVDSDEAFGSPKTVARSGPIPIADLKAGSVIPFPDHVPEGADLRYLRLRYEVNGDDPGAGRITAGVVAARQTG